MPVVVFLRYLLAVVIVFLQATPSLIASPHPTSRQGKNLQISIPAAGRPGAPPSPKHEVHVKQNLHSLSSSLAQNSVAPKLQRGLQKNLSLVGATMSNDVLSPRSRYSKVTTRVPSQHSSGEYQTAVGSSSSSSQRQRVTGIQQQHHHQEEMNDAQDWDGGERDPETGEILYPFSYQDSIRRLQFN